MSDSPTYNADAVQKAYATDDALALRQSIHELYSVPRTNFAEWVLNKTAWRGDESVLDVGSGQGMYFSAVRKRIPRGKLVGADFSLGMMQKAAKHNPHEARLVNTDAMRLPFGRKTFDVVLANHMLFHVPDVDRTLAEIKRVIRPTGVLLASTNSQFNLPELDQLMRRTLMLLGGKVGEMPSPVATFPLEDGAQIMAKHFFAVARYDLPGAFVFPIAQPAIDYVNSLRALREPLLPKKIRWEDFISTLSDQIHATSIAVRTDQ